MSESKKWINRANENQWFWRSPVQRISDITLLDHDPDPDRDGKRTFQRVPHCGLFRAGNFDFWLVNVHLYTQIDGKSSEGREAEYAALHDWFKRLTGETEKDAIAIGDFNRFLGTKTATRKAWKKLAGTEQPPLLRFVLLEGIRAAVPTFDPMMDEGPDDRFSTTTNNNKHSIYDQILIARGTSHEFVPNPQWDIDVGIVAFDNDPRYQWFAGDPDFVNTTISDHRPIWMKIRIDLPDDDAD